MMDLLSQIDWLTLSAWGLGARIYFLLCCLERRCAIAGDPQDDDAWEG